MVHQRTQLKLFLAAVRGGDVSILRTRALEPVVEKLRCDRATAEQFILDEVLSLTAKSHIKSIEQTYKNSVARADIFGHVDSESRAWYIKLFVDLESGCVVMSFHPPEHKARRQDGEWIHPW